MNLSPSVVMRNPNLLSLDEMIHYNPDQYFKHSRYLNHKKLDALYLSYFIKLFGDSFIGGLTTVFLLSKGFRVPQVALYFLIYFVVAFLVSFPARSMMKHIGVGKTLGIGILAYIVYCLMLRQIGAIPLELVGVVFGVASGLYFSAFNIELAHALQKSKTEGAAVAIIRIIAVLASVVGPLVGSIFMTKVSFQALLLVVSFISLASLLPLFASKDYRVKLPVFSIPRIMQLGNTRLAATLALRGAVEIGIDILWPAFIFLNYQSFIAVGGILSATSLLMTLVIYVAGKYSDLRQADSYRLGVLSHAPTWIIRLLLLSPGGLLISNILGSMTAYFIDIPFNKALYHKANESGVAADFFIFAGLFTCLGRAGLLVTVAAFPDLTVLFILISALTFLHLILLPDLKEHALAT